MGYAILRTSKISSLAGVQAVLRHNRREVNVVSVVNDRKNPKIIIPSIEENQKLGTYSKFFKERTKGQTIRKNAVRGVEVIMTFSKDSISSKELKAWLKASADFLANKFGGYGNIYDIQIHLDEIGECHAHAVIIPIDEKGKLNCRYYLGGADKMRKLQDDYAEAMKPFGLERGKSKKLTKSKHIASTEWHKAQAEKQARLKTYEALFGKPLNWEQNKKAMFYDKYDEFLNEFSPKNNKPKIELSHQEK